MRLVLASLLASLLVVACGGNNKSNQNPDGNGNNPDGNNNPDGQNGNPTNVSVTLTNRPNGTSTFTFIAAYQDGYGAWTLAPAPTGDTYTFPINSPAWGFAWTCIASAGNVGIATREVHEMHYAIAERTSATEVVPPRCSDRNPTNVGLTGNVSNRPGGANLVVAFGGRVAVVNANTGNYATETPPSTHDLITVHGASGGTIGDFAADQTVVQRSLAVNSATVANVDFATAVNTQSFAVSGISANGKTHVVQSTLYSANGTNAVLIRTTSAAGTNFNVEGLDATQIVTGDVFDQQISEAGQGAGVTQSTATATPAAIAFTVPAALGGALSSVPTTAPYPEVKTTWNAYTGAVGYTWTVSQAQTPQQCGNGTGCTVTWSAEISPGVAGTATPTYQMPDLSQLTGWSPNLQLVTGTMVGGSVTAMTSSAGASDFPAGIPTAGTTRTFARADYSVTP